MKWKMMVAENGGKLWHQSMIWVCLFEGNVCRGVPQITCMRMHKTKDWSFTISSNPLSANHHLSLTWDSWPYLSSLSYYKPFFIPFPSALNLLHICTFSSSLTAMGEPSHSSASYIHMVTNHTFHFLFFFFFFFFIFLPISTGAAPHWEVFDLSHVKGRMHGGSLQACKYQACHNFHWYYLFFFKLHKQHFQLFTQH